MAKARVFDLFLFFASITIAWFTPGVIPLDLTYIKALILYWIFSSFYFQLRIVTRSGNSTIDYAISYTSSFGIFAGPAGTFIFEVIYRFTVYFYKKITGTADRGEFLDTFYNIGSFTIGGTVGYYLYTFLYPYAKEVPFGYWILIMLIVYVISLLSSCCLVTTFWLSGDVTTRKEAFNLIFKSRNLLDFGKVALTNALLLRMLQLDQWEMLLALFLLNYIVSLSFYSKSISAKHKFERDQFEQMAYRDFLTGTFNRAQMDKAMLELDHSGERIGVVVADIDRFKKINDNYNHAVGDRVIIHFADLLKAHLTEDDTLFRSGGEEFTIFLRGKTSNECVKQIQEILDHLGSGSVAAEYGEENISVTYSASFGLYYDQMDAEGAMYRSYINADQLLLESKKLGRNRLTFKNRLQC
ncbi:GGDEF domain-containing protein [Paenibacillus sp. NFR01]|uniref:GGDEF domain-containing protein n=1 Tax=Paenibacillus sp. NFR01 TaxID=1566279 RepID=UPI0008C38E3B|nr:GGDEF domain-containing protein [Paenibacillus sp. NFR01]SEU17763.1 diguanylate cyclase (GGDEF) domain-containing protein [Paenibacillus sp. NFR01]